MIFEALAQKTVRREMRYPETDGTAKETNDVKERQVEAAYDRIKAAFERATKP